jgi:hypothetical protein
MSTGTGMHGMRCAAGPRGWHWQHGAELSAAKARVHGDSAVRRRRQIERRGGDGGKKFTARSAARSSVFPPTIANKTPLIPPSPKHTRRPAEHKHRSTGQDCRRLAHAQGSAQS